MKKMIYKEIAERYIESADKQLVNGVNIQEVIGFTVYHAYESIAMAFIIKFHPDFKVRCPHHKKLNTFTELYRRRCITRVNPVTISSWTIRMMSYREKFLYPEEFGSTLKSPKDQISIKQARKLKDTTKGIIDRIKNSI